MKEGVLCLHGREADGHNDVGDEKGVLCLSLFTRSLFFRSLRFCPTTLGFFALFFFPQQPASLWRRDSLHVGVMYIATLGTNGRVTG